MTRRCMAPVDGDELCGRPASEQRTVEGVVIDLCAEHARELDEDSETGGLRALIDAMDDVTPVRPARS